MIEHEITDEELEEYFPEGYERFPDEIYRKLEYHPATFEVLEHHIAVYRGKNGKIKRAEHPAELLKNSIATPSLTAGIMNGAHINITPNYPYFAISVVETVVETLEKYGGYLFIFCINASFHLCFCCIGTIRRI